MSTLYLDRKDIVLKIINKSLVCYVNDKRQRAIPLALLERLIISCSVKFSSPVLLRLASQGIVVTIINPRNSAQQAMLLGSGSKNPYPRLWQYRAVQNKTLSEQLAQRWITSKVKNQLRFLKRQQLIRKELRHPLTTAINQLSNVLMSLQQPVDIPKLLGLEGNAAKVSFGAYQKLLPVAFGFNGRKRRPPPDPVNACLSLTYTLLYTRATQQAYAQGLDPKLGFLHDPSYSRDSLAADLIEPWRPHVDEWVLHLFNQRVLRLDDFKQDQNACLLGKVGRAKFYASCEPELKRLSRALRLQIHQLKRTLEDNYLLSAFNEATPTYETKHGCE